MNCSLFLYIDPGTGSMLISVFIGIFASLWFVLQKVYIKFKYNSFINKNVNIQKENVTKIVIFSDSKRYKNIFLPILKELDCRKIKSNYITFDDDDPILNCDFKFIDARSIGRKSSSFGILNTLSAQVVLSTTPSLDVYQWKRSKNVAKYVHILHEVGGANEYRMFGLAFFDSVLLSGNFQIEEIREIEKLQHSKKKELLVVGSTYMDELQKEFEQLQLNGSDNNSKYVLVAPTWGKNGLLSVYGDRLIDALLDTDYKIIIRPHPQSLTSDKITLDNLMSKYKSKAQVEFNFDIDNFNVLNKSNVMISDYSGVIFDYSLIFDKPVLYFSSEIKNDINDSWFLEKETYRYEAMRNLGLKLQESDFSNLQRIMDDVVASSEMKNNRDEIKDILWQNRGFAAKAVVDYLVNI